MIKRHLFSLIAFVLSLLNLSCFDMYSGVLDNAKSNKIGIIITSQGDVRLWSLGDGIFENRTGLLPALSASFVKSIVNDYDNDGKADIALLSFESGTTIRLLSRSGSSFYQKYIRNVGYSMPTDMVIGDFNNDGNSQEFFISMFGGANICMDFSSLFWDDTIIAGTNSVTVASGDLNGDGYTDIFHGIESSMQNIVYLNNGINGSIGFTGGWTVSSNHGTSNSCTADIDNDGDIDIIEAQSVGDLSIYLNNGNATFTETSYTVTKCHHIKTVDLNDDGYLDIVGLSTVGIYTFINKGDGTFTTTLYPIIYPWVDLCFYDIDSDGDLDIIAAASYNVVVIKNDYGVLSLSDVYSIPGLAAIITSISMIEI